MPQLEPRKATYEDVLQAPEDVVTEIVDGELVTSPRPAIPQAHAKTILGMDLGGPFQRGRGGPGGWWILFEPELHLGDAILVPDLAGWRRERLPVCPDAAYFELAPDWVCEVLSESTRRLDRIRKLPIYARHRVAHAWLVDPIACTLEVFRLQDGSWLLVETLGSETEARVEPFAAVALDVTALWDRGQSPPDEPQD